MFKATAILARKSIADSLQTVILQGVDIGVISAFPSVRAGLYIRRRTSYNRRNDRSPAMSTKKKPRRYSYHPACLLFPKLGKAELQELADDIKANGLRTPSSVTTVRSWTVAIAFPPARSPG